MQHKELNILINKLPKFSYNKVPEALVSYFAVALKIINFYNDGR